MTYKLFRFFIIPRATSVSLGVLISLRFLYFLFTDGGEGHIQSLILAATLMGVGFFLCVIGLMADLISVNRKLLEKLDWRMSQINEEIERIKNG